MPTLASKLPYDHPFAGGYPRLGGQPLPTDPDAIDYLERVKAADGAAVEVGVAVAVDDFFKGVKADGTFSAIKAACIMCGARTLSGALVPLVGTAPTNVANNFVSSDYSRTTGLKGDGATKYLDSNRARIADGQSDHSACVYISTPHTTGTVGAYAASAIIDTVGTATGMTLLGQLSGGNLYTRHTHETFTDFGAQDSGFFGVSRSSSTQYSARNGGATATVSRVVQALPDSNTFLFARRLVDGSGNPVLSAASDARLAFYSIGSALDLALLDNRVSTLVAAIAAAI